jgi:hypothetical protein
MKPTKQKVNPYELTMTGDQQFQKIETQTFDNNYKDPKIAKPNLHSVALATT